MFDLLLKWKDTLLAHKKVVTVVIVTLLLIFYATFIKAPIGFPENEYVVIEEGMSVRAAAQLLEDKDIVNSSIFFTWVVQTFGIDGGVRSGVYSFTAPASIFRVAERLNKGEFGSSLVRVTLPEGSTTRDMAQILEETLPHFNSIEFLELARSQEGYLFPDTYFFVPDVTPEGAIRAMRNNFDEKISIIQTDIDAFGAPLEDVVIMASLLEKEARQFETKQLVSGILWKRIDIGMALQVDAVFGYILDSDTFSPNFDQLKIDSPYNTYTNVGLPPGPITNPGLESLKAAVLPKESSYLYYLTGVDGTMHYAETFDGHVANRRFLR